MKSGPNATSDRSIANAHVVSASERIVPGVKKLQKNSWMNSSSEVVNVPRTARGIEPVMTGGNAIAAGLRAAASVLTRVRP